MSSNIRVLVRDITDLISSKFGEGETDGKLTEGEYLEIVNKLGAIYKATPEPEQVAPRFIRNEEAIRMEEQRIRRIQQEQIMNDYANDILLSSTKVFQFFVNFKYVELLGEGTYYTRFENKLKELLFSNGILNLPEYTDCLYYLRDLVEITKHSFPQDTTEHQIIKEYQYITKLRDILSYISNNFPANNDLRGFFTFTKLIRALAKSAIIRRFREKLNAKRHIVRVSALLKEETIDEDAENLIKKNFTKELQTFAGNCLNGKTRPAHKVKISVRKHITGGTEDIIVNEIPCNYLNLGKAINSFKYSGVAIEHIVDVLKTLPKECDSSNLTFITNIRRVGSYLDENAYEYRYTRKGAEKIDILNLKYIRNIENHYTITNNGGKRTYNLICRNCYNDIRHTIVFEYV